MCPSTLGREVGKHQMNKIWCNNWIGVDQLIPSSLGKLNGPGWIALATLFSSRLVAQRSGASMCTCCLAQYGTVWRLRI